MEIITIIEKSPYDGSTRLINEFANYDEAYEKYAQTRMKLENAGYTFDEIESSLKIEVR